MTRTFRICLGILGLFYATAFADTIYIVGAGDSPSQPTFWTISPPSAPSSGEELDVETYSSGSANGVAISSTRTTYIVGQVSDFISMATGAGYWTISPSGIASSLNLLGSSLNFSPNAVGIAFNPSGIAYIVGVDASGNPAYWTVSPSNIVIGPIEFNSGLFPTAIAFSSLGTAYVAGLDSSDNSCYWTISNTGVMQGPFDLAGGEAGGAGTANAVAVDPSGTVYIVGANIGGDACYWTIPPMGSPSSAIQLAGGSNSQARGIAFLPSGAGMIVGQTAGNESTYWVISSNGTVGGENSLPNGSGSGSIAYAVSFSSDQTAYIIGTDNSFNSVYWTVPISGSPVGYNILGSNSISNGIAISLAPNAPTGLSGQYIINDFALLYENYVNLNWTLSNSPGIVGYNIYINGVQIAFVNNLTTQYQIHDQNRGKNTVYTVATVDSSGNEAPISVILN